MKKCYFIYRVLSSSEEIQLFSALASNIAIYYKERAFLSERIINSDNAYSVDLSPDLTSQVNSKHIKRITELGDETMGSKTVAELLRYNNSTYWFYIKFSLFHRTSAFVQEIEELKHLIKEHKVNDYLIYSDRAETAHYFGAAHCIVPKHDKKSSFYKFFYLMNYGLLFTLRVIIGFFKLSFQGRRSATHLILTNPYNLQSILDRTSGKAVKADPHLSYLIEKTEGRKDFLLLSQIKSINLSKTEKLDYSNYFRSTTNSKRTIFFEPFLFLALFSSSFHARRKELAFIKSEFKQQLSSTQKEDQLQEIILAALTKNLKMLIQAVWREEAASKLNSFLKIKSFTLIDEHSLRNRSLWLPLYNTTKIFAVQHGGISSGNLAYRFTKNDLKYTPLPQLTFIRGEYTKTMLMRDSIYKESDLKIVGHMRTDVIPTLIENQKKLPSEKSTILYATQPLLRSDRELKMKQYHDFFSVCSELPQFNFIVKPHPNETDLELYESMAKKYGATNYSIQTGDLYELIAKSDVVVTYYSTVGIEAIYFNKELITLDYNELDLQGYLKDGVSHNVRNEDELKRTIISILSESIQIDKSKKREFVKKRAFAVDGKTTERLLETILEF